MKEPKKTSRTSKEKSVPKRANSENKTSDLEPAALAENPIDVKAKKTTKLVPHTAKWKAILAKLLTESAYIPGPEINQLEVNDTVRILSSMPWHFRWKVMDLLQRGIRYFGKVPCPIEWSVDDSKNAPDPAELFRPVGCPEGPGENKLFGLAWLEDSTFRCEPPGETGPREYQIDHHLADIAKLTGCEFTFDLLQITANVASMATVAEEASHSGRPICSEQFLQELAARIRNLANGDSPAARLAREAFACGILYCEKVAYPGCRHQEGRNLFRTETIKLSIVLHALWRHGPDTNRKELLRRLGCQNADDFDKGSRTVARFDEEHSRYAPEFTFTSFDKIYKKAHNWTKNTGTEADLDPVKLQQYVVAESNIGRHLKTEGQKMRHAKVKKKVRIYDKHVTQMEEQKKLEDLAVLESSKKLAKKELRRQQNESAAQALKKMGITPGCS